MDYPTIIRKVKPSIAFIVARDASDKEIGTGSGFVFSNNNILVTCNHVVKNSNSLWLKFPDLEKYIVAKIVVQDDEHDLALLKFEDVNRRPLEAGHLGQIVEGMQVAFAGYPLRSINLTTHQGILSAIIKDATGVTLYSIDGTVNPGNSGCPLLNAEGKVIGVVNATRRVGVDLLKKVTKMPSGTFTMHGVDLVDIYKVFNANLQLGMGYAIPAAYIPEHKEIKEEKESVKTKKRKEEHE